MEEHSRQSVVRDPSNSPSNGVQTVMHASTPGSSSGHAIMQPPTVQGQYRSHMGQQALRSRHSSFNLSQHASNSPTSSSAPSPPLDSSSRHSPMPRSKVSSGQSTPVPKRPSTADSLKKREDITPWEFDQTLQPVNVEQQDTRAHHTAQPRSAPSVRSRTSSIPLGSMHSTGPVEDVTPWETHPGPAEEPQGSGRDAALRPRANTGASNSSTQSSAGGGIGYGISIEKDFGPDKARMVASTSTAMSLRSRASSAALAVGPLEEVTPWEVQELTIEEEERDSIPSPLRSPALSHPHSQLRAANGSARSRASSIAQRGTGTGTVAEVTPWEVQGLLLEEEEEAMSDAEEEPSHHRKSMDDHASVSSASKKSSRSGISSRFSRKSERKSGEMERIGEPVVKLGLNDRRKSFASGSNANIRASIEFGIKGGLGYGVPIEKHYETPNVGLNGPSGTAANGQGGLELENVTPWELYPVPPVPPLPSDLQPPFESPEQETITKRPKSRLIPSKAMLSLKGRGGHKSAEKDAAKKQAKEASRISTASNGFQALSSSSLQVANPNSPNAIAAAASTSSLGSYSSQPSNGHPPYNQPSLISGSSQHSLPPAQRPAMTGTVEDVLPWEMHDEIPPVPPLPSLVISDPTPSSSSEMPTPMPSFGQSQFALAQSRTGATQVESQTLRAGVKLELGSSKTPTPQSTSRVNIPLLSLPLPVGPLVAVNPWNREGAMDVAQSDRPHEQHGQHSEHDTDYIESPVEVRNKRIGSNPPSPIEASAVVGRKTSLPILKRTPPAPPHIPSPTQPQTPISAIGLTQSISSGTTATGTSISASVSSAGTGTKHRGSMTAEQLEQVTPWELQPGPGAPKPKTIHEEESTGSAGVSVVSGVSGNVMSGDMPRPTIDTQPVHSDVPLNPGVPAPIRQSASAGGTKTKVLSDLGIRRRRSTGASGATSAASVSRKSGKLVSKERVRGAATNGEVSSPSPVSAEPLHDEDEGYQFSTADRAILEQLKAAIKAKDAQFVLKGVGQTVLGGGKGSGKKHHPYLRKDVPYPRSYDREIVDLDVWETMVTQQLADSVTWHVFEKPPSKVLDIGCGTGTWILQCATKWKESHLTGLDVVPLHPNLQNLGSEDLSSRVTWVQHNYLDGLPFQAEEFDFVHIKRIALGVPEPKWDFLLEEIARVMKPGGALEMIEEDLFFPGTRLVEDDDNGLLVAASDASSMDNALQRTPSVQLSNLPIDGEYAVTPRVRNVDLPAGAPSSPPAASGVSTSSSDITPGRILPQPSSVTASQASSSMKPVIQIDTQHNANEADQFNELFAASSVMIMGSMAIASQNDPITESLKRQRQQAKEGSATQYNGAPGPGKNDSIRKQSPFLLRSLTRSPVNPRDHSILAAVWEGMLESRFINLTPLSLLDNYLGYHFKDIRTHAPIFYTFPYVIRKPTATQEGKSKSPQETPQQSSFNLFDHNDASGSSDDDEARDAIIPRPRMSKTSLSPPPSLLSHFESTNAAHSQYNAKEASTVLFPSSSSTDASIRDVTTYTRPLVKSDSTFSKLPNGAMNTDARTLNIHLSLRAKEILACSESMWEYVEACQEDSQPGHGREFAAGVDSVESDDLSSTKNLIMDMTRDDFDILLNHFEMDMLDKAGVGQALEAQYSWSTFASATPLDDRNAFNKACAKYDQWVADQKNKSSIDGHSLSPSLSLSSTGIVLPTPKSSISFSDASTTSDTISSDGWKFSPSTTRHSDTDITSILPTTYTDIPPEKLLSRVLRVYVAWKAPK